MVIKVNDIYDGTETSINNVFTNNHKDIYKMKNKLQINIDKIAIYQ